MKTAFIFILLISFQSLCLASECSDYLELLSKKPKAPVLQLLNTGHEFVTSSFEPWSYRQNGCGAVCALNLVQGLRLKQGLNLQNHLDQANDIFKFMNPNFKPGVFGFHGQPEEMKGLSVGRLAKLIEYLLDQNGLTDVYQAKAYQRFDHEHLLLGENIEFKTKFTADDISEVNDSVSKIILVSISDLDKDPSESFLTAHFYTVVKYHEGILYLHDPNLKNKIIKFNLQPCKSGPFESYQILPLDEDYKIVDNFPPHLQYMVNGLVTVSRTGFKKI